jgi:hypothetical protein
MTTHDTPNTVGAPGATASGFGLMLTPTTLKDARDLADMLAKSDLVPSAYRGKPGDIMIAGAMGARLGLDIFSSLAGIATINGRATLWGDAMLAVAMSHPAWDGIHEEVKGRIGDGTACAFSTVKRKGREPYVCSFSVEDARRAKLWDKAGPWSTMPQRMLIMRARSFALRGAFADKLSGFYSREEIEDEPREVEGSVRVTVPDAVQTAGRELPADLPATSDGAPIADAPKESPKEEAPPDRQSIDRLARGIADKHKTAGIMAIKAVNAALGVSLLSHIKDEQIDDAHARLVAAAAELDRK